MKDFTTVSEATLLVAFSDLSSFARYTRGISDRDVFDMMSGFAELVGSIVEDAGGKVVKFMGDAALIVFAEKDSDAGVRALIRIKEEGDQWLKERGTPCRNVIKAHLGPVVCGPFGTDKHFDVYGQTVNTAAMTLSTGLALTPQVFRKLKSETRKLLKKHTPPVTYIPVAERHQH